MKITSVIITSLLFGAAGALVGTLFAPGKGSKTRSKITKKGQVYKDYLLDNYHDIANSVTHPFESMEDHTIRLSKKAINKAEKLKSEALDKIENETS
ncbi:MAG: YtxH domain-containing protein [Balneolaceae bacterium]